MTSPVPAVTSSAIASDAVIRSTGDSFALGVMIMLIVNLGQRVVGLLRGLGFCHYLSDIELGHWALLNSYFVIAVPIAVLGLPGSFGRFVEYFRRRGQLGDYFFRVAAVSLCGMLAACGLMLVFPEQFTWLLFRQPCSLSVVVWCAIALASATVFSFVSELAAALREIRAVSLMQFVQSIAFAILALSILRVTPSWTVLLPSYSLALLLGLIPGAIVLAAKYRDEFRPTRQIQVQGLWSRILPYAAALWAMNLLGNLFEVSDRYMLLHLSTGGRDVGQAMVGQYHCGRILPNLLTSLAVMLGGILLPFLSADFEAGKPQRVAARLRQTLQSTAVAFMGLSVAAMCVAPLLFSIGFQGRYQAAQAILPLSLLQATWASLFMIAQSYMLCIERGKQLACLMMLGLVVNLGLNWWLIQYFGLFGAVAATSTANLLTLLLLIWRMSANDCSLGRGTLGLCLAPLAIVAGPVFTSVVLVVVVFIAGRTEWLLTAADRRQLDDSVLPWLRRCGLRFSSLWP